MKNNIEFCEIAREITMKPEWKVGRVIARPFIGTNSKDFKRTPNRHDYALKPFDKTTLNYLAEANYDTIALGKLMTSSMAMELQVLKDSFNADGMNKIINIRTKNLQVYASKLS